MLNDQFKRPRHLVQQRAARMLKEMFKPFNRAFTVKIPARLQMLSIIAQTTKMTPDVTRGLS